RRVDVARVADLGRHLVAGAARYRTAQPRRCLDVRTVSADADRGDERVARQIAGRRGRRGVAVAARAARDAADLDGAVDVRRARRMAGLAVILRVARRWGAVAAIAGAGGRRVVPPRLGRGAAGGVQHVAMAVHVAAPAVVEQGGAGAITRVERESRA